MFRTAYRIASRQFPGSFAAKVRPEGSGADAVAPLYSSSEEGDVANTTLEVRFNENVNSGTSDYVTGVTIKVNGATQTINSGTRQADQSIVRYVIAAEPDANDAITWEYSNTLGDIADTAGNQLADVTAQAVDNNIGEHTRFDNQADAVHLMQVGVL